jgi:tetratricopeptide (TPR) repeat protein
MDMHRSAAAFLAVVALLALVSEAASAQTADLARNQAQEHFQNGVTLMSNENWDGALVEFERSLELFPTRSALFNAANCLMAIHQYVDALHRFREWQERYIAAATPEEIAAVEAAVLELQEYLGLIVIITDVAGAEVTVDGTAVGTTPLTGPLTVQVGRHVVTVTAEGYAPSQSEVTVAAGEAARVEPELVAAAAVGSTAGPTVPVEPTPPEGGVDSVWFWTTASAAVALGAGAAVGWGLAYSTHQDFVGGDAYDADLAASGEDAELAGNVLIGIASAAAVTAVVLAFFTDFSGDEAESEDAGVAVSAAPGGVVLVW